MMCENMMFETLASYDRGYIDEVFVTYYSLLHFIKDDKKTRDKLTNTDVSGCFGQLVIWFFVILDEMKRT